MNKLSIKDICQIIWDLENKYDLLDLEIDGVKPWQFRRMVIYYELANKAKVIESPHQKMSIFSHLKSLFGYLIQSVKKNPFLQKKADVLIIPNERTKEFKNQQVDIYTYFLAQELNKQGNIVIELERPYLGKHNKIQDKKRAHADFFILTSNLFKKLVKINKQQDSFNVIKKVELELADKLGVTINLKKILIDGTQRFKINYWLYKRLLKKTKVKKVYCIIGYAYGDLIKACKDLAVEVIELQHGTFSKYHLGYSFPGRKYSLDYFPDQICVWSESWKNIIDWPISSKNIKIRQFDYLESMKNNYLDISRKKNKGVIISQGALTDSIASFILNNKHLFDKFDLTYKLHPGEYDNWSQSKSLSMLVKTNTVKLVKSVDLYKLFSESEYQIGVFSTAIYEGNDFGCKTILIDLPGIEYMSEFIVNNDLKLNDGIYSGD